MSKTKLDELGIKSIVNYLRKSRKDIEHEKKTGEDTLLEQKKIMDRVLKEYGIPYVQVPEIGSGDKIATRPAFQQVIKDLENEKFDAIAVREISRMGRGSYADMGIIYDLLVEKRIFIITPWKIYDPTNPADLRQIRFELFMSREEFETIKERLNSGRFSSAIQGKWVAGAPPFGYNYNKETGKLETNEKEAEVVRTIFDLYANGIVLENGKRKFVQFRALGTYLRRIGIKTPTGKSEWAPNYLKILLSNDRYIGTYRFNEYRETADRKRIKNPENEHIVIENNHPAIIDRETWDKVQYRINNRDTNTRTKLDFEPNRLAGLCVCTKCGRKFIRRALVQRYKKKDGSISLYDKTMLFCGTTGCTYVRYNAIEEDILETLKQLSNFDENTLENTIKQRIINNNTTTTADDMNKFIESKKSELKRRMEVIYEKLETKVYSDEMFLERKTKIDKELKELEAIQINQTINADEQTLNIKQIKTEIKSLVDAYETAESESEKNKLLHSIFDHINITILKKGSGTRASVHRIDPYLKSSFFARS